MKRAPKTAAAVQAAVAQSGDLADERKLVAAAVDEGTEITISEGTPEPSDEGEQVTPEEGMELSGVVERVLNAPFKGDYLPIYCIRDDDAEEDGTTHKLRKLREVAAMKSLRYFRVGIHVHLVFKEKVQTGGGVPKWLVKITVGKGKSTKESPVIFEELQLQFKRHLSGYERDFKAPEQVPF